MITLIYFCVIFNLIIGFYCLWEIFYLKKLKKIFSNQNGVQNLSECLKAIISEGNLQKAELQNLNNQLKELQSRAKSFLQKYSIVKFNPFSDGGGNLSFCLAVLDEQNTGYILTSMYAREQNRIYAKKIIQGKTEVPLNEEEKQAYILASEKNNN